MRKRFLVAVAVAVAATPFGMGQEKKTKKVLPSPMPDAVHPQTAPVPALTLSPPPRAPNPFDATSASVDGILKRLVAIRAEREALAKEETALKGRLRQRLNEQNELLRSLGADAGPAAAGRAGLYFPTTLGTERVFTRGGRDEKDVVTAVEKDGDGFLVTVAGPGGRGPDARVVAVSADKLAIRSEGGRTYPTPYLALLPNATAADRWYSFGTPDSEAYRVVGAEQVTVPAGTFESLRVEYGTQTPAGFVPSGTIWYVEGVGSVKHTQGGGDVLVLKSIKPGNGTVPAENK